LAAFVITAILTIGFRALITSLDERAGERAARLSGPEITS
jgi:hypothetical protein